MATLSIPYSFTAGTPALASEVNANFQAIVNWTQSNIGTDNLGILTARSIALPSAPTLAILSLQQTSSQPALAISNTGSDTSVSLTQGGTLAASKSVVLINDPINQSDATAAHMRMTLSALTTIPALEIIHGLQNTLKVQRTGISTDVNFTTSGNVGAAVLNATTVNTTNLSPVSITAPLADALAIKIKGRSSDNTSKVVFKNNADSSEYGSIESTSTKLIRNVPTGSSHEFQVNGVAKGIIDVNGVDGQYLKALSVTNAKKADTIYNSSANIDTTYSQFADPGNVTVGSLSIDATALSVIFIQLNATATDSRIGATWLRYEISGPGGYSATLYAATIDAAYGGSTSIATGITAQSATFVPPTTGTYTVNLVVRRVGPVGAGLYEYQVKNFTMRAIELR